MAVDIRKHNLPVVHLSPLKRGQRLREQTAGCKTFLSGDTRFLLVTKEMGYYSFYFSGFSLILIQPN